MKINDLEMQAHCDFMPYDTEIKKREILRELEEKYADNFQALRT